jgi:hypothetical protein
MRTNSRIHTDALVPGVFAEPLTVHDTVDAHLRTATVAGTTEPEPLAGVHADQARRALIWEGVCQVGGRDRGPARVGS